MFDCVAVIIKLTDASLIILFCQVFWGKVKHMMYVLVEKAFNLIRAVLCVVCVCVAQKLALYSEFTISDTLTFYGRIHGLTSKKIQERMNHLIDVLELPQKTSLVRNLR